MYKRQVLEHAGSAGGARTHEVHVVLDGQRHARERGQRLACDTVGIHAHSGLERKLGRHLQECLDPAFARLDGGKGGPVSYTHLRQTHASA